MNPTTEQIEAVQAQADDLRRTDLPALADVVVGQIADWLPTAWDGVIRQAIRSNPELVRENPETLKVLKDDLKTLEESAPRLAREAIEPWLLHETYSDDRLVRLMDEPNQWTPKPAVKLPRLQHRSSDRPVRSLVGAIGSALQRAGMMEGSGLTRDGLTQYEVTLPPAAGEALIKYEQCLTELVRHLAQVERMRKQKAASEAESIWDEIGADPPRQAGDAEPV
jgi:hypothetical protein